MIHGSRSYAICMTDCKIYLDTYQKTPHEFLEALRDYPKLESCRLALVEADHDWLLECGAKAFVRPDQWDLVIQVTSVLKLWHMHVIVSEEFDELVDEAVKNIRSRARPKRKNRLRVK